MIVDQIEVSKDKSISVRYRKPDGEFHREVFIPGQNLTAAHERIKNVARRHWTKVELQTAGIAFT